MTAPLRVLQVVTDDDRRGAQVFATDLQDGLRADGVHVSTVALAPGRVGGLPLRTLGPSRRHPATFRQLRKEIRTADVVVAHGSTTLPVSLVAGIGTRVPVVYRQISESLFWAPTRIKRARVALTFRLASRIVALAPQSAGVLVEHFHVSRRSVDEIPNGVPQSRFPQATNEERAAARQRYGVQPDALCVASIGALVTEKGTEIAIRAVARLDACELLVAGDGPERSTLEALARELAPGKVHFLGSVPSPPVDVLHAADVLVLPSLGGDSMPAVLIEAAFAGVASVATAVGAIGDVVVDDVTGILLRAATEDTLASALTTLKDNGKRSRLADAARTAALGRFEIGVVAEAWLATLQRATRRLAQ